MCAPRPGSSTTLLSGEDEARLTFLAVRRWFGWSAGQLLVLDIGGGSLEVAIGNDEEPDGVLHAAGRRAPDPHHARRRSAHPKSVQALRKHAPRRSGAGRRPAAAHGPR